ncbi:MFS transporter, partial [Brevibacterium paucivorans]
EWFTSWKQDYKDLFRRLKDLFQNDRQTFVFFIASAVFRDGLTTIFAVAGVLAASAYGFTETQVIYLGIAANVVAAIGCLVSGPL